MLKHVPPYLGNARVQVLFRSARAGVHTLCLGTCTECHCPAAVNNIHRRQKAESQCHHFSLVHPLQLAAPRRACPVPDAELLPAVAVPLWRATLHGRPTQVREIALVADPFRYQVASVASAASARLCPTPRSPVLTESVTVRKIQKRAR
jgi:hypothetical protein